MRLNYNILWIDDRPRQVEHAIEHVRVRLARKGFNLEVKTLEEVGDDRSLRNHFRNQDFDLLVVDYKMQPEARSGDQLIRSIRMFCDSTDIVFYSSATPDELRTKINVDGVYCVNRHHLGERLDHIIHSTIKKSLDLNNMRGMSLSQIADFDHLIDEIISLGHEKLLSDGVEESVIENICNTATKYHAESKEVIDALSRDLHISNYTKYLSSDPKCIVLRQILILLDDAQIDQYLRKIENYTEDVIQPRNKLAHAMQKEMRDGKYVMVNNEKEVIFGEDEFTALRIKLLNYKDTLESLKNFF